MILSFLRPFVSFGGPLGIHHVVIGQLLISSIALEGVGFNLNIYYHLSG